MIGLGLRVPLLGLSVFLVELLVSLTLGLAVKICVSGLDVSASICNGLIEEREEATPSVLGLPGGPVRADFIPFFFNLGLAAFGVDSLPGLFTGPLLLEKETEERLEGLLEGFKSTEGGVIGNLKEELKG